MKSKKKLLRNTTGVFGLVAIPTAAALGLAYGMKDEKVNLSLSEAHDFGEQYFDDQIVKVKDDNFAAGILYNSLKREAEPGGLTIEQQKAADISGLVRLDRKLDAKFARSVINLDAEGSDQGKINVEGGLEYSFSGIKEVVKTPGKKTIFGKDLITGMQQDAKSKIIKAILDFRNRTNSDIDALSGNNPLRLGIYFDKNVIKRSVSIYLYELKDFDSKQNGVIKKFVDKIEQADVVSDWANNFRYNVWSYPSFNQSAAQKAAAHDNISGESERVNAPWREKISSGDEEKTTPTNTGFPELFAGSNLMSAGVANNWYDFGDLIKEKDAIDLGVDKNGKLSIVDHYDNLYNNPESFKAKYPEYRVWRKTTTDVTNPDETSTTNVSGVTKVKADDIINRINDSEYISFDSDKVVNMPVGGTKGHKLAPIQFAEVGVMPFIEPIVDYANNVLKIKYTFKSFSEGNSSDTRSFADFNMGDNLENPYQICTYIKEIPLSGTANGKSFGFGNSGADGMGKRIIIDGATSVTFKKFYKDETTNIDPAAAGYSALKESVVKAMEANKSASRFKKNEPINLANTRDVLREFLTTKTSEFARIPIVGPGMGILGQMIPAIASSIQSWMDIGNMTNANPNVEQIYTDDFLDELIQKINDDKNISPTGFINSINNFTKEAWSDLNSLINLSGIPINGEVTARTYQLYQMLAAFSDIAEPIFEKIKSNPDLEDAYIGNKVSVLDQLMAWLKKNGIIDSGDSIMDIIDNYKDRLGTIVESIGINRPKMNPDLITGLVNLIPLPLFSRKGSEFNRDAAAILDALLNGKYIKPVASDEKDPKHHSDTYDRNLPAIIELLNGNTRTSIQTFFKHILNDDPKDLMQYVLGVVGADYSKTDTFADAITALYTVFQAKVPKYVMIKDPSSTDPKDRVVMMRDVLDENGDPIINIDKSHKQEPIIEKDTDGKDVMIVNPTFGGIGIAIENMYKNGIHSIPKDSYESVFKFIFGTVGSLVDMGTLSEQEIKDAAQGLYHFVSQGAGSIVSGKSTSDLTSGDISSIIRAVNAIANKEVISPELGTFIFDIMEKGVGTLTVSNIEPVVKMLRSSLDGAGIGKGLSDTQVAITLNHLFTGFSSKTQIIQEMGDLIPVLKSTVILGSSLAETLGEMVEGAGFTGIAHIPTTTARNNLQKMLKGGIANMGDGDWIELLSTIKLLFPYLKDIISDDQYNSISGIIFGTDTVQALQGIGHLLHDGLVGIDYTDISTIINVVNSLKLGFSIPKEMVLNISLLIQNILHNGIDASPNDIKTIIDAAKAFAGGSISNIINGINAGNPEQVKDNPPKVTPEAFSRLLMDFVVGNKYSGKEGLYAKDKITSIELPKEVTLATDPITGNQLAQRPGDKMQIGLDKNGDPVIIDNPEAWDPKEYGILTSRFHVLSQEIITGHSFNGGNYDGKLLTADELYERLSKAQRIPAELAAINAKVNVANAKVQIYIDAESSFADSIKRINAIAEIAIDPSLTGDNKDYFTATRALFDLLKKEILIKIGEKSIASLKKDQVSAERITEYQSKYSDAPAYLGDLNKLLTELNTGATSADFMDRMKDVFGKIASEYHDEGIKGVLPGLPTGLKSILDSFLASNTVGSDTNGKAGYDTTSGSGWFSPPPTHHPATPSTAQASFIKFINDNWAALFGDTSKIMKGASGWDIVNHFQASTVDWQRDFNHPLSKGLGSSMDMKGLANEMLAQIKDAADKKIFKQLIVEFEKHIS